MDIFLAVSSIFFLRLLDQTLGTLRMLYVNKGKPTFGAALGFVESAIWVVAISQVIRALSDPFLVVGYALGFPPIENDPGGEYMQGDYDLNLDEGYDEEDDETEGIIDINEI